MGSVGYLLRCLIHKFFRQRKSVLFVFLGLLIAALGTIIVASVARNRELQSPWYQQRSALIIFDKATAPMETYKILNNEYSVGSINGYALIADADTSGGISLGGQEGNLWAQVSAEDSCYSTDKNLFWIHQQAVPEKYFHNLEGLKADINGINLECAGLTYYGFNWEFDEEQTSHQVSFFLDGREAQIGSPTLEQLYVFGEWLYVAPVIVGAKWIAENDIPIIGICITLTNPNDQNTLNRISGQISEPFRIETDWQSYRLGTLTANEWVYLGTLVLAMLNVASLYYGLIDSYSSEFLIFRMVGASRRAIRRAVFLLISSISTSCFILAWLIYMLLLHILKEQKWLSSLPMGYVAALLFAFVGICSLLAVHHTRGVLRSFRKKSSKL